MLTADSGGGGSGGGGGGGGGGVADVRFLRPYVLIIPHRSRSAVIVRCMDRSRLAVAIGSSLSLRGCIVSCLSPQD